MSVDSKSEGKKGVLEVVKAVIISLIICLLLVLLSAFLINALSLSDSALSPINQAIKIISILVGCLCAFKTKSDGWVKGILAGVVFIVCAFILFSLLDGKWELSLSLLLDVMFGAVTGLISGILAVNMRK